MTRQVLKVDGMTCGGCANGVKNALLTVAGVQAVDVDLASKAVTLDYQGEAQPAAWKQTVEDAGFDVIG
ncbi:heavy-metal-associated domain-containing protein [Vogesella sp. LIG4]|uniref:heavy-metal-associated domain-containing protein n=1 Tax=Vogesella sp. LIG4 TaxID=1192162 RepID=UPI00081FCF35|nr:heavy metal-associated domain-containing protein [Vogesella sp. LIG4]SCK20787.1 copper chaperone [Vogesella sp. LIG4]